MRVADVLRIVGWCCIFLGIIMVFPLLGEGGGAGHEQGSAALRVLLFERSYGVAALVIAGVGVVVLTLGALLKAMWDS